MYGENELLKYVHIERFGTDEVDGINVGVCHVFPKIDGTNASVWYHSELGIACGSRNRFLAPDKEDNGGFREWATQQENLRQLVSDHRELRVFGEWLIPHSLKTYREEAWRHFYVFDVVGPRRVHRQARRRQDRREDSARSGPIRVEEYTAVAWDGVP